jgi:hypothetical protein
LPRVQVRQADASPERSADDLTLDEGFGPCHLSQRNVALRTRLVYFLLRDGTVLDQLLHAFEIGLRQGSLGSLRLQICLFH